METIVIKRRGGIYMGHHIIGYKAFLKGKEGIWDFSDTQDKVINKFLKTALVFGYSDSIEDYNIEEQYR
jgi:hypothetical protein